jgi:pimeloyl-ACP methyl ester carboxylesterase
MPRVTSHGTSIYYETFGGGPETLVLAHGMGGNAAIWFNQVAHFIGRYRIIAFDHRYFARSACPVDDFKPAWFPDDILAIMDAEAVERAIFVCQSMGGWTGSQVAVHHPDRITALVMSHTPGIFMNERAVNTQQVADLVTGIGTAFETPALAADFPSKSPAMAALYRQIGSFNVIDPAVIPKNLGEANIGVNTDSLAAYQVPTLFITADKDVLFPPAYIQALADTVPGAGCINLGDAGHSSYFEAPAAFNRAVDTFLATV